MNQFEFKEKVFSLRDQLFRFASRISGDSDEANDSVQDVMLKLWGQKDTLYAIQNISSYAYKTTRNICYDRLKHIQIIKKNEALPEYENAGEELSISDEEVLKDFLSETSTMRIMIKSEPSSKLAKDLSNCLNKDQYRDLLYSASKKTCSTEFLIQKSCVEA